MQTFKNEQFQYRSTDFIVNVFVSDLRIIGINTHNWFPLKILPLIFMSLLIAVEVCVSAISVGEVTL